MTNRDAIIWLKDELRLCPCTTEKTEVLRFVISVLENEEERLKEREKGYKEACAMLNKFKRKDRGGR